MRQNSPLFRGIVVCLLALIFVSLAAAQKQKKAPATEGALRVMGPDGQERGLCPLKRTDVKADVSGFISRVTVTQTFQNPLNQAIEAVYTFPLPNDAAVDALTIETGGRLINGKIMQRQKAKETYDAAKQEGKVAALLEQENPDIFTQSVANITPGAEVKVMISYVETLRYADDTYEFRFPMTIGAKYMPSETASAEDEAPISPKSKKRPGHTISMEINVEGGVPVTQIASATHEIETAQYSASKFTVRLKDAEMVPNKDFLLHYKTAGSKIEDAVLAHHDARGGFFTLILQPPDRVMPADTMPKEVVFVLDTSGSMDGFPINKAREAMKLTLDNLNPYDTFNLITFAGETQILFEQPVPATRENLSAAKKLLDDSSSGGGTEMMKAILASLEPSDSQSHVRIVCFMTDGQVGNENQIIGEVSRHPNARVFAFGIGEYVNHHLLDEITREGRGEVKYVSENDDGSAAARQFFERIRNPLMTDISLEFSGADVSEVYPQEIPDLFDTKPVTLTGRYKAGGRSMITLRGKMQGQPFSREIAVDLPSEDRENEVMATLWARKKLAAVMRPGFSGTPAEQEEVITGLGLDYHLVTPFTSFVAVGENRVTDGSPPKRVDVPLAEPEKDNFIENYWKRRDPEPAAAAPSVTNPPIPPGTPSGVSATVSVTADSVDTTSSNTTGSSITSQEITSLPVNGRSLSSLYITAPGTQVNPGNGTFSAEFGRTTVNGQRPTSNQFTIDGVDANRGLSSNGTSLSGGVGALPQLTAAGGTNSMVAFDAVQEAEVRTFPSAVEGRTAGGTFNVVTQSGTNMYHGSLFETFGNGALNAADPFARAEGFGRAPSNLNLFGGTLGGPFVKNKLFFFGNYEGMRLRQGAFGVSEVPSALSRLAAAPGLRTIFEAFSLANGGATTNGFAQFSSVFANPAAHDIFGFKTDIKFTDKFSLNARYNFANSSASWRGDENLSLNTVRRFDTLSHSLSVQANYVLTSQIVADLKTAFSRTAFGTTYSIDSFGGAVIPVPSGPGLLRYDLGGRGSIAAGPGSRTAIDEFQTSGTFNWIAGSHQISFGGDIRRLGFELRPLALERNVLFAGIDLTGSAARINEISRTGPGRHSTTNISAFGQDEWRINSRLLLTAGLRWDADLSPDMEKFATVFQDASTRIPNSVGNFAPRFSAAFDLSGNGKSVFRAGVGLYFDFGNLNAADSYIDSHPFATGAFTRSAHFSSVPANPLNPLTLFTADLKTPHTWQIFTEYQQELFSHYVVSASFVATFGRDLLLSRTFLNADPAFNVIRLTDNSGSSNYQALNLSVNKRLANNLTFVARYSLSRSTDNVSTGTITDSPFLSDPGAEKGPSDYDARHTFSIFGAYDIPTFFKSGRSKWWARDWTISANLNARSAFPVNVTYAQANDLGVLFYRPDILAGASPYNTSAGPRSIDPAAFSVPTVLGQGSNERNSLRGFPLFQLNASLEKKFRLGGEASFRIKAEAINVLNTVNYENMSGNLGTRFPDGTFLPNYYFGKTVASLGSGSFTPLYLHGGARTIQLSAKLVF
jgi:Ca-activated chloride channel family protein